MKSGIGGNRLPAGKGVADADFGKKADMCRKAVMHACFQPYFKIEGIEGC